MESATSEVYPHYRVGKLVNKSVEAYGCIMTKLTHQETVRWEGK